MSKLRSSWTGPITEHTTATSTRVWIRAKTPNGNGMMQPW